MAIYDFEKLQRLVSVINKEDIYTTICKNIKKFRLQRYNEFKNQNSQNTINPFSSENIVPYWIIIITTIRDLKAKVILLKWYHLRRL